MRQGENIRSKGRTPPQPLTSSRSSFPTLKNGMRFSGMATLSPVFGLRPSLARRRRTVKLPKPRISIFSPLWSAFFMFSKTVSTISSHSFFVSVETFSDSFSTRSLLVIPANPPCGLFRDVIDVDGLGRHPLVYQRLDLLLEQVGERQLLLRRGDDLRLALDAGHPARLGDGVLEVAQPVDQSERQRLFARQDAAVRDPHHLVERLLPAFCDRGDELPVGVVDDALEERLFLGRHGAHGAARV